MGVTTIASREHADGNDKNARPRHAGRPSKLNDDLVRSVVNDLFDGNSRKQVAEDHGVSEQTVTRALRLAVSLKVITTEQRTEYINNAHLRALDARKRMFNDEELAALARRGWHNGAGSDPVHLSLGGQRGGLETQSRHRDAVGANLQPGQYKPSSYYIGKTKFSSKGERLTALMLLEHDILMDITPGVNFQRNICGKKVDFYINEGLIVEFHPIPNERVLRRDASALDYAMRRKRDLAPTFNGEVVVITDSGASMYHDALKMLGIRESWHDFLEKHREAVWVSQEADIPHLIGFADGDANNPIYEEFGVRNAEYTINGRRIRF